MLPRDLSYGGVASATTAAGGGAAQPQVDPAAAHLRLETIADYV